ncbi:MAG: hypothetical protein VYD64_00585 [Pseudomonadota bacterium]|nr:hypothetical protein [Pseudomonadota bacterium]
MIRRKETGQQHPSMHHAGFRVPRRYRLARFMRMLGATLAVLVLASLMSAAGLYFLLRGESVENSTLNLSIRSNIERLVGPDYIVDLGRTAVAFDGLLSVAGTDVRILRATDRQPVSTFGRVLVGVKPLSLLGGEPQIDAVVIEDSTLDARLLPLPAPRPVRDISTALEMLGEAAGQLGGQFSRERFRLFRFHNVRVTGLGLGRREADDILVDKFEVRFRRAKGLNVRGELSTTHSTAQIDGNYTTESDGGARIDLAISGIGLREWLPDPMQEAAGPVGWEGKADIELDIAYAPDGKPMTPEIRLSAGPGIVRVGRIATTQLRDLSLDVRLRPESNAIELVSSSMSAGNFNARMIGGAKPSDDELGYAGPIDFEVIADPAAGSPTAVGERSQPGAMRVAGSFDWRRRLLDIPEIEARLGRDRAVGSASIGFGGETPSIAAAVASDSLSIAAIKQFWPFWIAPPARKWALANVRGGQATSITIDASIPGGKIGRFRQGAKMTPEEFKLRADFSGVRLATFGDLPEIADASGTFDITGMATNAHLQAGVVNLPDERKVELTGGSFRVEDFGERPARAEVRVAGEGDLGDIAEIATARPLEVPPRIDMRAEQFSGESHVDVVARFPIARKIAPGDVDWSAILELHGVDSADPIQGRTVTDADLHIEATQRQIRVMGRASVDGVATRIEMTEPVGGSGVARQREFTALVDAGARERMGLSLDPVITGDMQVRVRQGRDGVEIHDIELDNAEINLPWIGWTKGKGIAANASFRIRNDGGVTRLDDFYLEGEGFSAVGSIAFDKSGLVMADFTNVTLNEGDLLSVQIKREKKRYEIRAEGPRYDARGLINKLMHEGGFGEAQGDTSVVLSASIGKVRGFGGRTVSGLSMSYSAVDGWFDNLSLRGTFSKSDYISIVASTSERKTTFEIDATDAGAALGLVDVYRHMTGGRLLARLTREAGGPFKGPVNISNFIVENEPRLKSLVSDPAQTEIERGANAIAIRQRLQRVETNRARFQEGKAIIEKGADFFRISDGVLRGSQIGFTFDGLLYDPDRRMSLSGTFMPGMGLSRAIGMIPVVGVLLGNGRDSSLIGITFRLTGPAKNPTIEVNPMSIVAPGVFRKVFEYNNN